MTHPEILDSGCNATQSWQPATFLLTFAQHWACSPFADEADPFELVASVAQAQQDALRINDFISRCLLSNQGPLRAAFCLLSQRRWRC
jgi:hypothetical protein